MARAAHLVSLVAFGCGSTSTPPPPRVCAFDSLFAASDYSSSEIGAFALDGTGSVTGGVDLGSDPMLTTSRGRVFVIARNRDLVFELDARCGTPLARFSTSDPAHPASNPQDVAIAPDGNAWVPRYNVPSLAVVDPNGQLRRTIDLAAFDPDGNPNASSARIVEVAGIAKAFVALERLDDADKLKSKLPSWMLQVDVATGAVDGHVELAGRNPFGLIVEHGGAFFLAEPGNFDVPDEPLAGVERFDPQTGATRLLVTKHDLGASPSEVAVADGCAVAIVADATPTVNRTSLVAFDPDTGARFAAPRGLAFPTDGYDLQGLAWKANLLFVGDRRAGAGGRFPVHVFERTATCELAMRADTIFLPQKPVGLGPIP